MQTFRFLHRRQILIKSKIILRKLTGTTDELPDFIVQRYLTVTNDSQRSINTKRTKERTHERL